MTRMMIPTRNEKLKRQVKPRREHFDPAIDECLLRDPAVPGNPVTPLDEHDVEDGYPIFTRAVGIVLSRSRGKVSLFKDGRIFRIIAVKE